MLLVSALTSMLVLSWSPLFGGLYQQQMSQVQRINQQNLLDELLTYLCRWLQNSRFKMVKQQHQHMWCLFFDWNTHSKSGIRGLRFDPKAGILSVGYWSDLTLASCRGRGWWAMHTTQQLKLTTFQVEILPQSIQLQAGFTHRNKEYRQDYHVMLFNAP